MKDLPQISDAEWEVMKALWERSPASVNELCEGLASQEWHPKTVRTMLTRLVKKGVVDNEVKDGIYHYYPLVSREECSQSATLSFINRVFDGALAADGGELRQPPAAHRRGKARAQEVVGRAPVQKKIMIDILILALAPLAALLPARRHRYLPDRENSASRSNKLAKQQRQFDRGRAASALQNQ